MQLSKTDALAAIASIQYLYRLKYEVRYAQSRTEEDTTESVAEHCWGMHLVATYFLPLENPTGTWNRQRIFEMITWHDIDEVETGDTVSFHKTQAQQNGEAQAVQAVLKTVPEHMRTHLQDLLDEYEKRETIESRFVKAVDKIEPIFHLLNEKGKQTMRGLQTTAADHERVRAPYLAEFPTIQFFHHVSMEEFKDRGHFVG